MILHDKYGYGQLFCYNGLDGETSYKKDFIGMLMAEPITIRFHFHNTVSLKLPFASTPSFKLVSGDIIDSDDALIIFSDKHTVIGKSKVKPEIITEKLALRTKGNDGEKAITFAGKFSLKYAFEEGYYYFAFSYGKVSQIPDDKLLNNLKKQRYDYFTNLPVAKDEKYAKLLNKCYSINKENVFQKKERFHALGLHQIEYRIITCGFGIQHSMQWHSQTTILILQKIA